MSRISLVIGALALAMIGWSSGRAETVEENCLKHASYFRDYDNKFPPVFLRDLNLDAIKKYCEKLTLKSNQPQFQFMYSRYLEGMGNFNDWIKLITKSIENGYPAAAYYLGDRYEFGIFIEKSINKAAKYYNIAHNLGHPDGTAKMGGVRIPMPSAKPSFISVDIFKAKELLNVARSKGSILAMYYLGRIEEIESPLRDEVFPSKKSKYLSDAMEKNNREALFYEARGVDKKRPGINSIHID